MKKSVQMKPKQAMQSKPTHEKQPKPAVNKPSVFDTPSTLNNKKTFYITVALLGGLALFVFYNFLVANNVFLFKDIGSDSINVNYPQLFHIADYLQNIGGVPKWSFYQGMGQNYLGYLTADPFDLLLYFTKPENIVYMLGLIEALKFITAGLFFFLFLRELKLSSYTLIVGTICFAFCGFIVLGSGWRIFSSEVYQAAFLLFAIEKLLHKKWYYFPFAIALIGVTVPFNLFIYSIVTGVYVFVRLFNKEGGGRSTFIPVYGQIIGLGALGVGISAFVSINKSLLMLDSPRVSGSVSYASALIDTPIFRTEGMWENLTKIGRLFSNDLLGTGNYFAGAGNYLEAPLFYVGLLSLLLFTQFFPYLSKQKKWIFGSVFLCALLPFIFPFFRYALWLFSGDYYRGLSFLFALLLLVFSLLSLHHIDTTRKINFKVLLATLAFVLLLLFMPNIVGMKKIVQPGLQTFCFLFLLLYTFLLALFRVKGAVRFAKPVLVGLIFVELAFMANTTINKRDIVSYGEIKSKVGYNDYSVDAVKYIHSVDTAFYRIQKTYASGLAIHSSLNDPLVQRFYGTTSYSSFNQSNYVKFLLAVVMPAGDEHSTRWLNGLTVDRPLLQIFGNVRYNLSKQPFPPQMTFLNEPFYEVGDVHVYRNKFALPFGYTYSHYVPRSAFDSLSFKDIALLKAVVIDDADAKKYAALAPMTQLDSQEQYGIEQLAADVENRRKDSLQMTHFSQNNIQGKITLSQDKLLFFTIPFDKNWKVFDNGKELPMEQVNIGFSGVLLGAGAHTLELRFIPAAYTISVAISLISLLLTLLLIGWFCWGQKRFCTK